MERVLFGGCVDEHRSPRGQDAIEPVLARFVARRFDLEVSTARMDLRVGDRLAIEAADLPEDRDRPLAMQDDLAARTGPGAELDAVHEADVVSNRLRDHGVAIRDALVGVDETRRRTNRKLREARDSIRAALRVEDAVDAR